MMLFPSKVLLTHVLPNPYNRPEKKATHCIPLCHSSWHRHRKLGQAPNGPADYNKQSLDLICSVGPSRSGATAVFFKSTIVVQFLSGTDSLALDWLSLVCQLLVWREGGEKKSFTLVNVKVSANCPCHQSLWQKVRDKLSSNGQRQTKQRLT